MTAFSVSYDLRKPTRNYEPLYERLRAYGAVRALQSLWLVDTTSSAVQLRDDLRSRMDSDDGLLVTEIGTFWAAIGITNEAVNWLKQRRP